MNKPEVYYMNGKKVYLADEVDAYYIGKEYVLMRNGESVQVSADEIVDFFESFVNGNAVILIRRNDTIKQLMKDKAQLQNKLDSTEVAAYDLANILAGLNLADVQVREYAESMRERFKGERK